jgi:DNA-binding beta-propeller fold protein YncE
LGNNSVGIVDLKQRRLLRTMPVSMSLRVSATKPRQDTVYVANGGDGSLRLFRAADFSAIGTIDLGADADNVRVDPKARRVYVGHDDGAIAVIDAAARKRIADIPFKGHPESFQLESDGPRIFVNVPDAGSIQILSRETNTSIGNWSTDELQANYPLAVDLTNHRVLAVFRRPARMEAFDAASGKRLGGAEVCGDADDVFVDAKRERVYVICGEGWVDSYASGASFSRVDRLPISRGSRTGLYLPDNNQLAVAIRAAGNEPAAVWLLRTPEDSALIVMVCEHGNVKSLMAASYFNELATARHPAVSCDLPRYIAQLDDSSATHHRRTEIRWLRRRRFSSDRDQCGRHCFGTSSDTDKHRIGSGPVRRGDRQREMDGRSARQRRLRRGTRSIEGTRSCGARSTVLRRWAPIRSPTAHCNPLVR